MKKNLENYPGVKINGENINNIRYADDTVLIADSEENLQRLLDITIEKSEEMGLTLNVKKTECMVISKKAIAPSCNLQSRGQQIKLVKKFKYLGYMITSDGKCITEIKKRIATAKDAFQKLSLILKNRNISMTTKFRVLKTYVWSTLTYGCECWTITSDIEKKIEAEEMWFIRRMLRISWTEKKPNVNVLREGNVQRSRDVNGLKKKKEIHDKTMKFENYATLTSESYCLSLLQTLLIAGCIIFLLS